MKRAFIAFAVWFAGSGAALACGLDDCALPDEDHLESRRFDRIPADDWGWMNHDLALARSFLEDGDTAKARQIVAGLDYALRLRADDMVAARGRARVMAFHRALRALQLDAEGPALAHLNLRRLSQISGDVSGSSNLVGLRAEDGGEDGDEGDDRDDAAEEARRDRIRRQNPEPAAPRENLPGREMPGGPSPRF